MRGHFTGHYLSACVLRYASAGDEAIKTRAEEVVAEFARCQAKMGNGGYLSAFPTFGAAGRRSLAYDKVERQGALLIPTCTSRPGQHPKPLQISRRESPRPS